MRITSISVQYNKPLQASTKFGCGICTATGGAIAAGVAGATATGISQTQAATAGGIGTALGGMSAVMAKMSLTNFEPMSSSVMAGLAGILAAAAATLGVLKLTS